MTLNESLTAHAASYLRACLEQAGGNVHMAAQIAGVHRSSFYSLCKKCEVIIPRQRKPLQLDKALSTWLGVKPARAPE
jgi:DNA-binding NtrC family response regulator